MKVRCEEGKVRDNVNNCFFKKGRRPVSTLLFFNPFFSYFSSKYLNQYQNSPLSLKPTNQLKSSAKKSISCISSKNRFSVPSRAKNTVNFQIIFPLPLSKNPLFFSQDPLLRLSLKKNQPFR